MLNLVSSKTAVLVVWVAVLCHPIAGSLPARGQSASAELQLPSLGDASAGLISPSQEYELGQALLRRYRGALPTSSDPFIESYLSDLLQKVATYSDLQDKRLELLVLENRSLNAFAAPGGIVGVNTGTFLITENEQQLASILAHELAHLSQRHYARQLQQQKTNSLVTLTALLASIMVAASSSSDVGTAAIPTVQAAAMDAALRFSRDMEKEADRVGMQTMVRAGFNPYAVPEMFELMLKAARYRTKVPEFLLTHPVTESRIADSMSRATRYPRRQYSLDEDYQLIRARVILQYESSPTNAVKRFEDELRGHTLSPIAARYGLVMALTRAMRLDEAKEELETLREQINNTVALTIAEADIYAAQHKNGEAVSLLRAELQKRPNNHPLNIRYAEILMAAGQYDLCESVLKAHVQRKPDNAYVWYLLAEVHGLAGNIFDVHKARAEYFILRGVYSKAEIQLRNALRMVNEEDFQSRAKIEQRLMDVREMQRKDI